MRIAIIIRRSSVHESRSIRSFSIPPICLELASLSHHITILLLLLNYIPQPKSPNMRISSATLIAFAAGAIGAPSVSPARRQTPGSCDSPVKLDASTNVWESYKLHANSFYRSEVEAAAAQMSGEAAEAALRVADIGTFLWA